MADKKKWLPLESNPEVMNTYLTSLGVQDPTVAFNDVFGLDADLLAMLPGQVLAMLLVFPITEATDAEADETAKSEAQGALMSLLGTNVFFMKQTIGNACGTIGILHALMNTWVQWQPVKPGSFLDVFAGRMGKSTPEERAAFLVASDDLDKAQAVATAQGVTAPPRPDDDVNLHFVAFVRGPDGTVLELDGRQPFPLVRGVCTSSEGVEGGSFLDVVAGAIKARMALTPESMNYTVTALCKQQAD